MAMEGGYAAAGQFKQIADQATASAMAVANMASNFAIISTSLYSMSNAVQAFANLEQTLTLTQGVAQGTAEQYKRMSDAVRDFALAYKTSAADGASALYALASAGYTTQQSLEAMNGVMQYSQGTLTDTAHAADTLSASMTAFGLAASEANNVANLFMASIAVSQASPEKLAYAMRQVAPVAASMSTSITQTVAALSELFNVGNRGQQAGTLLRDVMLRLAAPTGVVKEMFNELGIAIQTTSGESRNFIEIMKDIQKLNLTTTSLKDIFDSRGVVGAQVLLRSLDEELFKRRTTEGSKDYDAGYANRVKDMQTQLNQQVVGPNGPNQVKQLRSEWDLMMASVTNTQMATRIANAQLTTLASSFSLAKNSVTELGLQLGGQLAGPLQSFANGLTDATIAFRGMNNSTKSLIVDLPILAAGAYAAVRAISAMVTLTTSMASNTDPFGFRRAADSLRTLNGEFRTYNQFTNSASGQLLTQSFSNRGNPIYRDQSTGRFVAPSQVTTTAMNPYTGAAATGASALGAAVGVAGTILTVATIGMIAYQVLPMIYKYVRDMDKPDADINVKNYATDAKRIVSSTALGGATDIEQYKQLTDQIKQVEQAQKDLGNTSRINEQAAIKAEEALRSYLITKAKEGGNSIAALQLMAGSSTTPMVGTDQSYIDGIKISGPLDDFLNSMSNDKGVAEYKKKIAQAKSNIEARKESDKTIPEAFAAYRAAVATLMEKEGMKERVQFETVVQANKALEQEGVFTWQSGQIMRAMEKDARTAELNLRKMQADLNTNPVDMMMANIDVHNDTLAKKWTDWASQEGKKIDDQYSGLFANSDLGKALTGQSYAASAIAARYNEANGQTELVFQRIKDAQGKNVIMKGALDVLKEGGSDDQVKAAFEAAIKERIAAIEGQGNVVPENIRAQLDRMKEASAKQIVSWLSGRDIEIQQEIAAKIDSQRQNYLLVTQLRNAMSDQFSTMLTQIFNQGGSNDFSIKGKIDVMSINRQYEDALKQLDEEEKNVLKQLVGKYKEDTTLKAAWEEYRRSRVEIATRTRNDAIANIMLSTTNAQQEALNRITTATENAKLGSAQIAGALEAFLTAQGLPVSDSLRGTRSEDLKLETYNAATQKLRELQEARDKLDTQIAAAQNSRSAPKNVPSPPLVPNDSVVGPSNQAKLADAEFRQLTDDLNAELARLANYREMQKGGIDAYKAIETTQDIIRGLREKLAGNGTIPVSGNTAPPAPPVAQSPVFDTRGADAALSAMSAQRDALTTQIELQQRLTSAVTDQTNAIQAKALAANSAYAAEQKGLDEMKRLYERNGTVIDGMKYAQAQLAHNSKTDFQIAAEAYTSFANSASSNLTDLITGQQKDWKVALANIARDIASTILRALVLRALTGLGGAVGLPTGLAPVASANGNVFMNGNVVPHANGGLIESPIAWRMPDGRTGTAAEAGTEAIMPLKRGRNGKLGVQFEMPVMPMAAQGRQTSGGNLLFSPQFNIDMGGGGNTAQPSSSGRETRERMLSMKRDLDRETQASVSKVIRQYQRPGGELNPTF